MTVLSTVEWLRAKESYVHKDVRLRSPKSDTVAAAKNRKELAKKKRIHTVKCVLLALYRPIEFCLMTPSRENISVPLPGTFEKLDFQTTVLR